MVKFMATYLLTWNPINSYDWEDIDYSIKEINENGYYKDRWSCGVTKSIKTGDRVFLIELGSEPRGIVASGIVDKGWYQADHWNEEKREKNIYANYVDINFDIILNAKKEKILMYEELHEGKLKDMHWLSQSSGISIQFDIAIELENVWSKFIKENHKKLKSVELITEEIINPQKYYEGALEKITVNKYERNGIAREECLNHYGYTCYCCGVNLKDIYGEIAKNFIHVHHITPLASIGKKYELNPIKDLIPMCPNCHAIIHRVKPELSIDKLKEIICNNRKS